MSYDFVPGRMYRMPTHFGPVSGPRSDPDGQRFDWSEFEIETVAVAINTDARAIDNVLPPGFSCLGAPKVNVAFSYLRNVPWLAGRGYNTLGVSAPARHGNSVGNLILVLWENLADPILTGREELGMAKIYCEIPLMQRFGGRVQCAASWLGHHFCALEITDLREDAAPEVDPETKGQLLHYKYMPKTEQWGEADVEQITLTPEFGGGTLLSSEAGAAALSWGAPRWEDMPTQFHIVRALRDLCSGEVMSCRITRSRGIVSDHHDQKVVG